MPWTTSTFTCTNRVLIGAAAACATALVAAQAQPKLPNPVNQPGAPWAYAGFVVNAPDEAGWQSAFKNLRSSAVGKSAGVNHTYALTVNTFVVPASLDNVEALTKYLKEERGRLTDLGRFEVLSHSEIPVSHLGRQCSRYQLSARDKGVVEYTSLALNMAGITCTHPEKPDLAIDVGYSERGGWDRLAEELTGVGDRFIASLRFILGGEQPVITQGYELMRAGDFEGVKRALVPLTDAGNRFVALRLGEMLLQSKNAEDLSLARKYLEAAALDGHPDALYNLGAIYDQGLGVPRDVAAAVRWFTLAADQRDAQAQLNLGILHHPRGNGTVKDINVANNWLRMAADNGNAKARRFLGSR